jgi:hypothetical protein
VKLLNKPGEAAFRWLTRKAVQMTEEGAARFLGRFLLRCGNRLIVVGGKLYATELPSVSWRLHWWYALLVSSVIGGIAFSLAMGGIDELYRYLNKAYILKISIKNFTDQTWKTTGIAGYNHTLGKDEKGSEIKWDDQPQSLVLPPVKLPGKVTSGGGRVYGMYWNSVLLGAVVNVPGIAGDMTTQGVRIIHQTDFFFSNSEGGLKGLAVTGAVARLDQGAPTSEGFNFAYEVRKGHSTDRIALDKGPGDAQGYYNDISDKYKETEQLEIDVPTHIIAHTPTLHDDVDEMYQLMVFVGTPA